MIGSRGEYLIPPKQRKELTDPRTRPCLLLGYEGNTNYRILLEDGRIIGTPNAEFQEVLNTPSTQTREVVGAKRDDSPGATAAAAGWGETVGLLNQPSIDIRHASVPASGRQMSMAPREQSLPQSGNDNDQEQTSQLSDDDSQPVAGQGDTARSPTRSDDVFGPFSDAPQDTVQGNSSPTGGDQQQDDARQDQWAGNRLQYAELQLGRPQRRVQKEVLEHHPELKIRVTQDTSTDSEEELALMNIPEGNVIPTFLTIAAAETEPFEPKTLWQARNSTSWPEWENAMSDEVNSHKQNKTWELVDPPKDRRILSGKWIFKIKRGPHGETVRYKCRWVVRGFTQEEGIDYDETSASVVKPMSYKALLAIAAALDLEVEQMDVKTAFLYGYIDHDIYVEQPHHITDGTTKVCKLRKALYGLKQAPRIWYQTLTNFLRNFGFEPINAGLGISVRRRVYVAVYVDDLLIIGPSMAEQEDQAVPQKPFSDDRSRTMQLLPRHVHSTRPTEQDTLSQAKLLK